MKYAALLFLSVLLVRTADAQSGHRKHKHDYTVVIDDSTFVQAMPDRGAKLTGYYKEDTIQKIVTWFGFNFGDVRRDYYYWKDSLIMVIETQKLYSTAADAHVNPDSVKASYTGRYIFSHNELTDVSQKGTYSISDTPADKGEMEKTFLALSDKYLTLLDQKRANKKSRIPWDGSF